MYKYFISFLFIISSFNFAADKLQIGVTLQPYYSYVKNIVKDRADVYPTIRLDLYDSHSYQPTAEDIKNVEKMDVIVVNGVGHDEFIFEILDIAKNKDRIKVIFSNKNISLMPVSGSLNTQKLLNSHTFISITSSIQQVYNITKELGEIDPKNKEFYMKNAREYVKKLRKLKSDALSEIKNLGSIDIRVATFFGGYDYLFSEFGIDVKLVIEPSHGAQPSAADMKKVIDLIKKEKIDVIFGEKNFSNKFVDIIHEETGVPICTLEHLTTGEFTEDNFEKFIKIDLDEVINSIKEVKQKNE